MTQSGIGNDTTVVLYGDNNNWFAAWAFWQMKIYGHKDVRIMDGGRKKWLAEGRDLDTARDQARAGATPYHATEPDYSLRAFLPQVQQAQKAASAVMIDVRSPQEFTGEILAPPGLPETCQRGGHIPGARSVPWGKACNDDGTFKSVDELAEAVWRRGRRRVQAGDRLLPHWRALQPHLVRAEVSAGRRQRDQLRRLLDRVGQSGGRAGRKGRGKIGWASMKPENFSERKVEVDGWQVNLTTYQLGDKWHTKADNVSPGAALARDRRRHARGRRSSRSGPRQRAAFTHQTPRGLERYGLAC